MPTKHTLKDLPVTPKVWGSEVLVTNGSYCGKILRVKPGYQCSIHYHRAKRETFLIQEGTLELELFTLEYGHPEDWASQRQVIIMHPGDSITLEPYTPHRFSCASNEPTVFYEFSTHDDPADSYRIEPSGPKKVKIIAPLMSEKDTSFSDKS